MTTKADRESGESGRMRRGLTAVIVILFISIILLLVMDVRKQLERLAFASSDNVQWFLSQGESEGMALELAAYKAMHEVMHEVDPDIKNLRLRFDIFYSRIDTLRSSPIFGELTRDPNVKNQLEQLDQFFTYWIPIVDATGNRFEQSLPAFAEQSSLAQDAARQIALKGIGIFSEISDAQRASISQTLTRIAILTIALVTVLIIVVLAMFRLAQIREQDAQTNLEISERMEAIIATALDAVIVADRNGVIVEYNGAAESMFGYPRQTALGANISDLIIPADFREMHREGLKKLNRKGADTLHDTPRMIGQGIVQLDALHQDGTTFPVDLTLARTDSREGEIFVSFIRDISNRVRSEETMRDARDRAIAGEKQKADLLAVMSHEMRTPLNGLLGTLDLFEPQTLSAAHQHYLDVMRQSGHILLSHVNDVLDISRLDAGKMSMQNQSFDLIALLQEIIDGQRGRANARGNELIMSPMPLELTDVFSDPGRLRQILLNLLGNAIKFTKNGKIFIEAECHNGLNEVEIRVIDTGLGISQTDLDRVFGDFVTIDSSYARSNRGTGLGLGISQRLVTAMGGDMGAESELGQGSVFWVSIPMSPPALATALPPAPPPKESVEQEVDPLPPQSVLLVEDNPTNRMVAGKLLERDGHTVTEAVDGSEGVKLALGGGFDLILMDISMPGMDGITATQHIRQDDADTPIIATTAHAMPSEAARFIEAGMNAVLVKPLTRKSLRKALVQATQPGAWPAPPPAENLPRSNVAIIDEMVLTELLEELPSNQSRRLLALFRSEMEQFLLINCSNATAPLADIGPEAHRMAGSAGVFGASHLNAVLRDIQTAAQDAPESLPALCHALSESWETTLAELKHRGLLVDPPQDP
ncbi:hybrid sensor histidine kinase/response regulator [Pelagimonas varians]|uniref:histidine kinase n=1 Tax=Pelagimonas varians TaxID=696760 RepID=A0A238K2R6_9RHOB|nr:response regulator [Pelagimonas varians]PYG33337.1 PAS/PAC sensor hybrid histidine kinase [Pelagimonas varians]SMX36402.1 Aerobic respiration control sensor protein ArcB [Pelagimonas varians]